MTGTVFVWFLKSVLLLGSALMAYKLYRTGLHRRYPIFFAYFLFRVPNSIWPLLLNTSSPEYQKIWICTEPIVLAFYILLVRELYRLVLEKYKGLYTLGRWAMYLSMAIAVFLSGLSLIPRIKPTLSQTSKIMTYVIAAERGVHTALAIFIVLLLLFLSRYPVRLSPNVRTYAVIYSIFFMSLTFVSLMRTLFGRHMIDEVNVALMAVTAICVVAWLMLLTPQGAEVAVQSIPIEPHYEHRLLTQLDSFNAALLKVGTRQATQAISHKS
jgi:hypothetical protein